MTRPGPRPDATTISAAAPAGAPAFGRPRRGGRLRLCGVPLGGPRARVLDPHGPRTGTRAAARLLGALALAGCASSPGLPYAPAQQTAGAPISADVRAEGDRLRVEIDTGGARLEDAHILKADGAVIRPQTIEHPGYAGGGSGVGLGLGVGGGSRRGVGVGVGVGTTLGTGTPRSAGHTFVYFPLAEVGPAPHRLVVKVVGVEPVMIVLDPSKPRS